MYEYRATRSEKCFLSGRRQHGSASSINEGQVGYRGSLGWAIQMAVKCWWKHVLQSATLNSNSFLESILGGKMCLDTVTSLTLLEGLRDSGNREAWERFTERYRPMVVGFAVRLGLSENDAQDASQETMLAFVKGYREGAYNRDKGRLRSWLFGVAHRKTRDIQRRMGRERVMADRSDGSAFLGSIEAPDADQGVWEQEWQRAVLRACLAEVSSYFDANTLKAFELYVLEEWSADGVAEHLGTSRNVVYIGKNRVMSRLRELRRQMEEIW